MKAREIHIQISPDERLLVYPGHHDRFVIVDHQDMLPNVGDGEDAWDTDADAGLCIPARHLDALIQALQDIRAGMSSEPSSLGEPK